MGFTDDIFYGEDNGGKTTKIVKGARLHSGKDVN